MNKFDQTTEQQEQALDAEADEPCPRCRGHGADPMSDNVNWLPCGQCEGSGKRRR
jgi:DnaJ-class molecular chaperone